MLDLNLSYFRRIRTSVLMICCYGCGPQNKVTHGAIFFRIEWLSLQHFCCCRSPPHPNVNGWKVVFTHHALQLSVFFFHGRWVKIIRRYIMP